MKSIGILAVYVILAGCSGSAANDAAWQADCKASQQLYAKAVAAMCSPWGEQRANALGDLLDASKSQHFEEEVTGETVTDYIDSLSAKDCVEAGFPNPGEAVEDEGRAALREHMRGKAKKVMSKNNIKPIKLSGKPCPLNADINKEKESRKHVDEIFKSLNK